MICRELDGYYFRVERDGKWCNVCFTDLTDSEAISIIKDKSDEWLESIQAGLNEVMCKILVLLNHKELAMVKFKELELADTPYTKVMKTRYNIIAMAEIANIVGC